MNVPLLVFVIFSFTAKSVPITFVVKIFKANMLMIKVMDTPNKSQKLQHLTK